MTIERVIIKNYKGLKHTDITFGAGLNILVGDNEAGKSTVLEAINLALTRQLSRRDAGYELHPFLFHQPTVKTFIDAIKGGGIAEPISILIEVYFKDTVDLAIHKGDNNSRGDNCPGVRLAIELDERHAKEYQGYIADTERLNAIPVECYHIDWKDFAGENLTPRTTPIRPALIDPSSMTNTYAANRYLLDVAREFLTTEQQVDLALSYRQLREVFQQDKNVAAINTELATKKGVVSDRELSVALDMTARASWETSVMPHLDDLPIGLVGKGEQTAVKIKLALEANESCEVLLVEEPENHLSHANLNQLIGHVADRSEGKQLIITTHSSFVLNKLGADAAIMFDGVKGVRLSDLPDDTRRYFMRLPGHNTLRMVLASRTILVEGPSDELIVQKAYKQKHGKAPLEDRVEVITVNSLAFKRFLDIAKLLELDVCVVTDNDKKPEAVKAKYEDYSSIAHIDICYDEDPSLPTLEPHLIAVNGRLTLNEMLGQAHPDDAALLKYMTDNKADVALSLFESGGEIKVPDYIARAVR